MISTFFITLKIHHSCHKFQYHKKLLLVYVKSKTKKKPLKFTETNKEAQAFRKTTIKQKQMK